MVVLGIDPGIEKLGYSFIKSEKNNLTILSYGLITTKKEESKEIRFLQIYRDLETLLDRVKPDYIAVESLIFAKNVKTALVISEIRGIIILLSALNKIPLFEFTPLQVKMAITGYGRSSKSQIQKAVKTLLNLSEAPSPDDISDAIAVSICGVNSILFQNRIKGC